MNSEKNPKYKACDITLEQYIKLYSPEDYEAYKAGKLPKEDLSEYEHDFKVAIQMRESYTVFDDGSFVGQQFSYSQVPGHY